METKRVIPAKVVEGFTAEQKACDHPEWKNTRISHMPIVWVHKCKKCGAEVPM